MPTLVFSTLSSRKCLRWLWGRIWRDLVWLLKTPNALKTVPECWAWRSGGVIKIVPHTSNKITRRWMFSLGRTLVDYLPMCWWFHMATGVIKRRANSCDLDDKLNDATLKTLIQETIAKIIHCNPVYGMCCATGRKMNIWIDASSLTIRVLLMQNGFVIEGVSWLHLANDTLYIYLAELGAALKSINLTIQWQA